MLSILITGATGFLGKALCSRLSVEENVEIYRTSRTIDSRDFFSLNCDLTNISDVREMAERVNPDLIIHTAAFVPKSKVEYECDAAALNVLMTKNLLTHLKAKIINISSMTVYGVKKEIVYSEDAEALPETAYGKSKLKVEMLLNDMDIPSVSLRIPGLIGEERKSGLVYNTFQALSQGKAPRLPDEPIQWAAMDVCDVVHSITKIAVSKTSIGSSHKAINLGYHGVTSVNHFLKIMERLYARKISYNVNHPDFKFDLRSLTSLKAEPNKSFEEALVRLKIKYGF